MGRPLSGKTAPQGRMSLIDRVSGGSYTPPAPQPLAMPRQLENVGAPEKNNEVKPAAEAVAAPKKAAEKPVKKPAEKKTIVSEADEVEAHKKKVEAERAERDIKAYAQRKAQKDAAAKLKKK
jgi:hypothetical protein